VPKTNEEIKIKQAVWPPSLADTVCPRPSVTQTFDQTGVRVASKVGNFRSKFGHARPMGSRIIRYVHDGRTDRGTGQKQRFLPPSLSTVGCKTTSTKHDVLSSRPLYGHLLHYVSKKQEAQLSQRDRAMLRVIEYFTESLEVTESHSKWHFSVGRVYVSISILLKLSASRTFLSFSASNTVMAWPWNLG